jgi:hypothetical protein
MRCHACEIDLPNMLQATHEAIISAKWTDILISSGKKFIFLEIGLEPWNQNIDIHSELMNI